MQVERIALFPARELAETRRHFGALTREEHVVQTNSRASLIIPILTIAVGVGQLLTVKGYGAGVNWVLTLGLASIGVLAFLVAGFNKASVVLGPFFLLAALLSWLRQSGRMSLDTEVPVLVIGLGVLLLVAHLPAIPPPVWLLPTSRPPE
jgi:hypothetical protein